MKVHELRDDLLIIDWLCTLNPAKNTEKVYLQGMQIYTEWTGKDPEPLLTEAEEEIRAGKLMRQRSIKKYLIGFRKYLQDQGLAELTVRSRLTGVKSFYKTFDIEIPSLPRAGNRARPLEENKDIPNKEDLQEVLKVCDLLERAVLLVGASSGLSSNEIRNLKIKDFKRGYDQETEITILDLRRGKVGVDFITFLTPEASRAVWDYLNYREREPKYTYDRRMRQLSKQRMTNEDGYLFVIRNVPDEFLETQNEEHRKLQDSTITKIYRSISEKAQKNTPSGQWNLIRSHNVRKYFNSAMLNAGADSFFVEFAMGHTLDDTRAAYFRASPEKLRDIYQKFVPYLTIQKDLDISESPEYQKIKKENQVLQAETARHIVERSELQDLKAEFEIMKESMGFINTKSLPLAAKDSSFLEDYEKLRKSLDET